MADGAKSLRLSGSKGDTMAQPELPTPARRRKQGARLLVLALALGASTGVYWRQPADLVCTTAGMGWMGTIPNEPRPSRTIPSRPPLQEACFSGLAALQGEKR